MAWTQTDIDTLKAAIASGALSVMYAGPPSRSITYRSLAEMAQILAMMEREVAGASAPALGRNTCYRKGFRDA